MATSVTTRPAKQYLGNSNTKRVHDLNNENGDCQISEILADGNAVVFSPDSLSQASTDGYKDKCDWCLG